MNRVEALARAQHLLALRRPREAVDLLWPLVAADPGDGALLAAYGRALCELGSVPEARRVAHSAAAAAPDDPDVLADSADLLRECDAAREALPYAERALVLAPHSAAALHSAATVCSAVGDSKRALALTAELQRRHPDAAFAHNAQAMALRRAGRYASAERAIRVALELDPAESDYRNNLAAIQLSAGRIGAAGHTLAEAIAADPSHAVLRSNIAAFVSNVIVWLYGAAGLSFLAQVVAIGVPRPAAWLLAAVYVVAAAVGYRWWRGLPTPLRDATRAYAKEKPWERRSVWLALVCLGAGLVGVLLRVPIPVIVLWSCLYGVLSLRYWVPALRGRWR